MDQFIFDDLKLLLRGAWLKTVPPGTALRLGIILSRSKFIGIRIQFPFSRPGFLLWVGKGSRRQADTRQPSPSLMYWDRVMSSGSPINQRLSLNQCDSDHSPYDLLCSTGREPVTCRLQPSPRLAMGWGWCLLISLTWALLKFHPSVLCPIVHEICSPVFPHPDPVNRWLLTIRWL